MFQINNGPVVVTGEERRHPAIRMLARACIALARLRLEQEKATNETDVEAVTKNDEPADGREEGAANG